MTKQTLEISKANATAAYKTATGEHKTLLENLFGKENLVEEKKKGKITDRIKTFKDACEELGVDYSTFMSNNESTPSDELAYKKLKIIRTALNEGWMPDWNDSSQAKYFPWFDMRTAAGFGFSHSDCDGWRTDTVAGSRLCFKSSDLAIYAGETFLPEYKDFMTE